MIKSYFPKYYKEELPCWHSGQESTCQCRGTQVQALVWEDPTCRGATKPVHHNY